MTTQLYVFISSRMVELAPERHLLHQLLPTLSSDLVTLRPWVFEDDAPASSASIRQVYLDALKRSALYIGLFWNDYGEWTIDEFKRATDWGIDRHIYVKNVETQRRDPRLQAFLDEQSDVLSGITPKWFTTPDDLAEQVRKSIEVWLKDYLIRRPGDASAALIDFSDDVPDLPARLIGRDTLLKDARALLDQGSQVLLQGFGGMGKSALAATLAANWIDDGKGAVLWLRAGSENADTLFEALARPFDGQQAVAGATGSAKLKIVRDLLAGSAATLLVLDDAWDGAALNQVLKAVPRKMPVLVTSRQRYAMDDILEVGRLDAPEALSLLGHYARQDYAGDEAARELCRQLGYHAFALEIAGKTIRVDQISPRDLLQRIETTPHELVMPEDFAEEGRTSVIELLNASLYVLEEPVRRVFLAFGALFTPSATPELLRRYLGEDEAKVREALAILQRRGLAEYGKEADHGLAVYRIHDLAYSYARTIFSKQGVGYPRSIETALDYLRAHETESKALDAELGNLLGAAQAARQDAALIEFMRLLAGHYVSARGYSQALLDLLDAAIALAERLGPEHDEARHVLLGKRGNAYYDRGDLNNALRCYRQELELAQRLGLREREVIALCSVGKVLSGLGEADEAGTHFERAYQIAGELDNDFLRGYAVEYQGYNALSKGDLNAARGFFAEEVALGERIGDVETQFYALLNLGSAEHDLGHLTDALAHHRRALDIALRQDNRVWIAHARHSLGEDYHRMDSKEQARECLREALSLFRESGLRAKVAEVEAYMKAGDYPIEPE